MNKKIIGILVYLLFVSVSVFPSISTGSENYIKSRINIKT